MWHSINQKNVERGTIALLSMVTICPTGAQVSFTRFWKATSRMIPPYVGCAWATTTTTATWIYSWRTPAARPTASTTMTETAS